MFYIGAIILVLGYYFTHNWVFYLQSWEVISVAVVSAVLFCVLAILNVRKMTKKHDEKVLIQLAVPVLILTICGGTVLVATIKCVSICAEGFGWVLTTNKGWQICPRDLELSSFYATYAMFSLMFFLVFCILSIITYMVCNHGKKNT